MPTSEPQYVKDTLDWCNVQRRIKGQEPLDELPLGRRGDGNSCPCGRATGLFVGQTRYEDAYHFITSDSPKLPAPVQKFVRAFDAGRLPQYVERT